MKDHKILVVDDDLDIVSIIRATLKVGDDRFISASDGIEAVEKVFTEMPDLIILDVMLPKMNGYQVCRLLRNDRSTWNIPIIMLTARDKEKDRFYGLSVGADCYLVKPFHPSDLRDKVNELLAKSQGSAKACPVGGLAKSDEVHLLSKVNSLLDRKLQEMTFLQSMTKAIASTLDEEKILEEVLRGITGYLEYKRVIIFMQEEDGSLVERVQTGFPARTERFTLRVNDPHIDYRLMGKREAVVATGAGWGVSLDQDMEGEDVERQVGLVPIVSREKFKGVIYLDRQEGEPPFSEERLGVLSTLTSQLAFVLDNAALYRATLHLSITDGLTGLYNARYFYERLDVEMSRARRYNHDLTLLMLDIDFFKRYNDTYGHLAGDEALKLMGRILRQNTRDTDTVARYGGEEFCVVLPETDAERATHMAERIRVAVEETSIESGAGRPPDRLTVSVGIAALNEVVLGPEDLVKRADSALYMAKDAGRNRVFLYS